MDKRNLYLLLSEIFKHQITNINPNFITRLDSSCFDLISKVFPSFFLQGMMKKIIIENEKKGNSAYISGIFKFISGKKLNDQEIFELSSSFNQEFLENDYQIIINLFSGKFETNEPEHLKMVIQKLKDGKNLPPGFIGAILDIFLNLMENKHLETAKQVLRILEIYSHEGHFNNSEARIIATLISQKFFDKKLINISKVIEIITKVINGEKVDYISLELISGLSNQGLLGILPLNINEELKDYLKFLPFSKNEVKYFSFDESEEIVKSFLCAGKIKISGLSRMKFKIILNLLDIYNNEIKEISLNKSYFFKENLNNSKYRVFSLKLISKSNTINISLDNFMDNELLIFNISDNTDIFYYGTLKIFLNSVTYLPKKLQLKNEYKNFIESFKINGNNSDESLGHKIKINPRLFNN